jgi:hypothetical protein
MICIGSSERRWVTVLNAASAEDEVQAALICAGDVPAYGGRELLVTGTQGTWYHEDGQPVAGLAIECRSGSARWFLYRQGGELLSRISPDRR